MKGRRFQPCQSKTLLNCWRQMLERINEMKLNGGEGLDPHALAEVTDYILDNIDHYRPAVPARSAEKVSLKLHSLPLQDNRLDNQASIGAEND